MHEIIVGNIGTVYSGDDEGEAGRTFASYKDQSATNKGRAGREDITWIKDGKIFMEHYGSKSVSIRLADVRGHNRRFSVQ